MKITIANGYFVPIWALEQNGWTTTMSTEKVLDEAAMETSSKMNLESTVRKPLTFYYSKALVMNMDWESYTVLHLWKPAVKYECF